ncbi:hypothetical protein [Thermofilum pendens]|uniref:Uncharacterized protein n=1 Tax=Thermofilum pendens (strain DSM 2475 / Hrk 5) TaxID=368408 RepID=A1S0X2_THEPD|nr:hypothetical protein [Thermofilum pendens]ABL79102.1 hypothetical protein Tpen_1707 [Thermofilum pendens Hrk 5]
MLRNIRFGWKGISTPEFIVEWGVSVVGARKKVVVEVPCFVGEEDVVRAVEEVLCEKYGVVAVDALRRRLGVTELREDVPVYEDVAVLREKEGKRVVSSQE